MSQTSMLDRPAFRSRVTPTTVALGALLGALAAFTTGWHAVALVFAAIVLATRLPLRPFAMTWSVGAVVAWLMTPASYQVGRTIMKTFGGAGISRRLEGWPGLLFPIDRLCVVGGIAIGLLVGAVLARVVYRAAKRASETGARGKTASTPLVLSLAQKWLVPAGLQSADAPGSGWFRPAGAALAIAIVALGLYAGKGLAPALIGEQICRALEEVNQAEVSASDVRVSWRSGVVELADVQFADPSDGFKNRLRLGYVSAQLDLAALAAGRLDFKDLSIEQVRTDEPRQIRARFVVRGPLRPATAPLSRRAAPGSPLEALLKDPAPLAARLRSARGVIHMTDELSTRLAPSATAEVEFSYMRTARIVDTVATPAVVIRGATATDLPQEWQLDKSARLTVNALPALGAGVNDRTRLELVDETLGLHVQVDLRAAASGQGSPRHEFSLSARGVKLAETIAPSRVRGGVKIEQGTADLDVRGWCDAVELDGEAQVAIRELVADLAPEGLPAGLSVEQLVAGVGQTGRLNTGCQFAGPWESPRLSYDSARLVADCRAETDQARTPGQVAASPVATAEPPAPTTTTAQAPATAASTTAPATSTPTTSAPAALAMPSELSQPSDAGRATVTDAPGDAALAQDDSASVQTPSYRRHPAAAPSNVEGAAPADGESAQPSGGSAVVATDAAKQGGSSESTADVAPATALRYPTTSTPAYREEAAEPSVAAAPPVVELETENPKMARRAERRPPPAESTTDQVAAESQPPQAQGFALGYDPSSIRSTTPRRRRGRTAAEPTAVTAQPDLAERADLAGGRETKSENSTAPEAAPRSRRPSDMLARRDNSVRQAGLGPNDKPRRTPRAAEELPQNTDAAGAKPAEKSERDSATGARRGPKSPAQKQPTLSDNVSKAMPWNWFKQETAKDATPEGARPLAAEGSKQPAERTASRASRWPTQRRVGPAAAPSETAAAATDPAAEKPAAKKATPERAPAEKASADKQGAEKTGVEKPWYRFW